MNHRASGILLHLTSLASPYPIGDLGPAATAFVDFMVAGGQRWWQMLPIGPTGEENSPYQSSSAFAGNPLLISPDRLIEQGLLDRRDVEVFTHVEEGTVDYTAAVRLKKRWLKKAFEQFVKTRHGKSQSEFAVFAHAESFWLGDFSLFIAIQDSEGTSNWTYWKEDLRTRQPDALDSARNHLANDIRYHQFVQWQFSVQWKELKAYCASKGVRMIGDIPQFVAHESADVWAHPKLFKLDAGGTPTVVAGVPPDDFSKTGQLWGLPIYCWEALREENYRWWVERLRMAFRRFDVNRLDHFIGFVRTYEVSVQAKTALNGKYEPGGGESFFKAVQTALGFLPFIADDLGATTTEVVALIDQLKIPGMQLLQSEFGSYLEGRSLTSELHPIRTVVYTGTHDNDTTEGWYTTLNDQQRRDLQRLLSARDEDVVWAMIDKALASPSETAIVPLQDLLKLGSEARMNFPGIAKGNWRWRVKEGVLTKKLAQRLLSTTQAHGRLGSFEPSLDFRCQEDPLTTEMMKQA
jgi:4-alpha-glucanotransferase